jgi:hypothetical protein
MCLEADGARPSLPLSIRMELDRESGGTSFGAEASRRCNGCVCLDNIVPGCLVTTLWVL